MLHEEKYVVKERKGKKIHKHRNEKFQATLIKQKANMWLQKLEETFFLVYVDNPAILIRQKDTM